MFSEGPGDQNNVDTKDVEVGVRSGSKVARLLRLLVLLRRVRTITELPLVTLVAIALILALT